MRNITFLIVILLLFGACANSYQKALKNPDNRAKLEMADTYYKKKDFARAISLYEMVEDAFNGTPSAEKILYNSAQCNFALKQYALAGFQFKTYFENFPSAEDSNLKLILKTSHPRNTLRKGFT